MKKITNTHNKMRHSAYLFAGLLAATQSASAALVTFDADSSTDWATPTNWSSDAYPTSADHAGLDQTADLNTAVANDIRAIRLGTGAGTGILNVSTGGVLTAASHSSWDSHIGSSSTGILNLSGGSVGLNYVEIGRNATGTLNVSGGNFTATRGKNGSSIFLGTDDGLGANGTGNINISGGVLMTRTGVTLGNGGAGIGNFNVIGSTATIGIGSSGSIDGNWVQNAGSTLSYSLDSSGLSKILIDDVGTSLASATFGVGSLLDLSFAGTPAVAGTWTLMEVENGAITDNGLALTGASSGWSFAVDNSGSNGLLKATYAVPEPSSTALLGLGGLALILRRRRS